VWMNPFRSKNSVAGIVLMQEPPRVIPAVV
jgi:hypothetical protein